MILSYPATYYRPDGTTHPATIFISSVTVTIRYTGPANEQRDIYWLEKQITSFDEKPGGTEIKYLNTHGETERLMVTDAAAIQELKRHMRHNRFVGKPHQRVFAKAWKRVFLILGIFLFILVTAYLWIVPWIGERIGMSFSKEYEINLGEEMYKSIATIYTVDEMKTATVNTFYQQLHYKLDYPIQVTVVKSPEVNAFAIPGGHIVVFDAILDKMKTPEELAALLGHEASHVALRHSLRNMFRSMARKMFLALVLSDDTGIISVAVDNADELKGLQYSRSLETEADNSGLHLMAASGLDPQGMVRLMELLRKESGGHEPSSLLSTHPVFDDRIRNIKQQIQTLTPAGGNNEELKKTFERINGDW